MWFKKQKTTPTESKSKTESTMFTIDGGIGLLIDRKSIRPFYDSEWEISVSKLEEKFVCKIVRYDDETAHNLAKIIKSKSYGEITKEFINSLDQKNQIFYD